MIHIPRNDAELATLTREQAENIDIRSLMHATYDPDFDARREARLDELLPEVPVLCDAFRRMYDEARAEGREFAPQELRSIIADIASLPAYPLLRSWSRLCAGGNSTPENLAFAKFVHRHLARPILAIFGVPPQLPKPEEALG